MLVSWYAIEAHVALVLACNQGIFSSFLSIPYSRASHLIISVNTPLAELTAVTIAPPDSICSPAARDNSLSYARNSLSSFTTSTGTPTTSMRQ